MATPTYTAAEFNALSPAERDALGSNYTLVKSPNTSGTYTTRAPRTPDSLLATALTRPTGMDRTFVESESGVPVLGDPAATTPTPTPTPTTPTVPTAPTIADIASPAAEAGGGTLLASLRRGILTGAQVQGGARTFRGGGTFGGRFNKNAASLRIGKTKLDSGKRKEVRRRKQTNTLGLNLGSSVGLQV